MFFLEWSHAAACFIFTSACDDDVGCGSTHCNVGTGWISLRDVSPAVTMQRCSGYGATRVTIP